MVELLCIVFLVRTLHLQNKNINLIVSSCSNDRNIEICIGCDNVLHYCAPRTVARYVYLYYKFEVLARSFYRITLSYYYNIPIVSYISSCFRPNIDPNDGFKVQLGMCEVNALGSSSVASSDAGVSVFSKSLHQNICY